jgi:two-component system, NtrC family, response regulator GlrR
MALPAYDTKCSTDEYDEPSRLRQKPIRFGGMVGRSAPMRALFASLEKSAASDATVLLEGETGTGKDASAEAIHGASPRRDGPFVVIDCGAIPPQLFGSELFGCERGAYTGSVARAGAFEAASGGTIFLDEIGELLLDLQPKLLRAIERRQVKRVGSTEYRPVDLRVIAATNRSLRVEVDAKRFREDLYYRLAVVRIKLPPLRGRLEDFPLLVEQILANLCVSGPQADAFREATFTQRLADLPWPGNIRQLRNHIERCVALGDPHLSPTVDTRPPPVPDTAPRLAIDTSEPLRPARERWTNFFERAYLEAVLAQHDNSVAAAARTAGIDRIHFYRLLWKHGLREPKAPSGSER